MRVYLSRLKILPLPLQWWILYPYAHSLHSLYFPGGDAKLTLSFVRHRNGKILPTALDVEPFSPPSTANTTVEIVDKYLMPRVHLRLQCCLITGSLNK